MAAPWALATSSPASFSKSTVRWWRRAQDSLPACRLDSDGPKNRNRMSSMLISGCAAT